MITLIMIISTDMTVAVIHFIVINIYITIVATITAAIGSLVLLIKISRMTVRINQITSLFVLHRVNSHCNSNSEYPMLGAKRYRNKC